MEEETENTQENNNEETYNPVQKTDFKRRKSSKEEVNPNNKKWMELSQDQATKLMRAHKGISSNEKFNFNAKEKFYYIGVTLKEVNGKVLNEFCYKVEY